MARRSCASGWCRVSGGAPPRSSLPSEVVVDFHIDDSGGRARPLPGDGPDIRPGVSRDAGRRTHPGLPAGSNRAGRWTNPGARARANRAYRVCRSKQRCCLPGLPSEVGGHVPVPAFGTPSLIPTAIDSWSRGRGRCPQRPSACGRRLRATAPTKILSGKSLNIDSDWYHSSQSHRHGGLWLRGTIFRT